MNLMLILFFVCLAIVAFSYAAVGHGGASGYIALFTLFGMVSPAMKSFVLLMNLLVAAVSFYQYYQQGHFNLNFFLPWGIGAAPMAYVGARLHIDAGLYHYFLAFFLFFSSAYLLGFFDRFFKGINIVYQPAKALSMALVLGFISGITGVGGGIFLSPLLLLLGWQNVKQTAALSALFIVVNSLAGLIALYHNGLTLSVDMWLNLILVIIFGYAGSRWGANIKHQEVLKRMMALVLLIAAFKLCIT
jgi:uncharacterized membrane protein YfcA